MKISVDLKNMNNLKKYSIIFLIIINSLFSKAQVKLDSSFKTLETITVISRNLKISDSNSIQLLTKLPSRETFLPTISWVIDWVGESTESIGRILWST